MTQVLDGPDADIGCQRGDAAGLRMDHHFAAVDNQLAAFSQTIFEYAAAASPGRVARRLPQPDLWISGGGESWTPRH